MRKCPICGAYMTFKMRYNTGKPIISWNCLCGYSTEKEEVTYSDRTE